jgi:hypothetical protein
MAEDKKQVEMESMKWCEKNKWFGVDKFIDFLLLHVDKTIKIQGTLFVAEYIVKLCKDRKMYNKKFREETLEKIKEINEQRFDQDYIYNNHGEDEFNTWSKI